MAVTATKPRLATIVVVSNGIEFTITRTVPEDQIPDAGDVDAVLRLRRATYAALRAALAGTGGMGEPSDDMVTVAEAAKMAHKTEQTIRNYCVSAGIGKFSTGSRRFWISKRRLLAHLDRRRPPAA
jgi:hypothetical protein